MVQIIWLVLQVYSCQKCQTIKVQKPSKFTFCNSLQTKIVRQVEFNIFVWSFKSLIQNLTVKCWVNFSQIMAHENTRGFSHDKVENKLFKASVFEWTTDEFTGTWRSLGMTAPQNSAAVTDVTFHSTHRKGYEAFWGLLYCDDRRSSWWASRDGLQHDHIRSDTVMISMNFNNYASLVIFFIISVLFCFVFEHWTLYTIRVLAVFDFYYRT